MRTFLIVAGVVAALSLVALFALQHWPQSMPESVPETTPSPSYEVGTLNCPPPPGADEWGCLVSTAD